MKIYRLLLLLSLILITYGMYCQVTIKGFIFESGNRGYINQALVTLSNESESEYYGQLTTDESGAYEFTVSRHGRYLLQIDKKPYFDHQEILDIREAQGEVLYFKHELKRHPGYVFEITLSEKDAIPEAPKDALKGALIEVYNNTKREEVLVIEDLQSPEFKVDLLKGNHYTILIRMEGFLSKRMEAFVDVEGCILCFEGIGSVTPGVSDNLSEGNSMGVLLANVEMDRYFAGKIIGLNDIYYDFGKSDITPAAAKELDKLVAFLKDNPQLQMELGSHTDSRGSESGNMKLSQNRAKAAVNYLINHGGIDANKIAARGYGESQLTNKCSDDVPCSEEEHQRNRRTELKVLDVAFQSMQHRLRQMKAEELIDEILADLNKEGQVKVSKGQTLEEALLERSPSTSALVDPIDNTTVATVPQAMDISTMSDITMPHEPQVDSNISTEATEPPRAIQEKQESTTYPTANPTSNVVTNSLPEEAIESKGALQEKGLENLETLESGDSDEPKTIQTSTQDQAIEEWIRPSAASRDAADSAEAKENDRYSETYTGYKVVVIFSRYELPKEHTIWSTYQDVDVYTTADGNKLYMLGAFANKEEATAYMKSDLKKPFPQSYVVGFDNGIRVY